MRSRLFVLPIGAIVWVLDLVSKRWALNSLADGHSVRLVGDFLQLRLTANPGAAFSMGTSVTWVFTALAAAVAVGILWFAPSVTNRWWLVGMGGLFGGALGNLTDRLTQPPSIGMGRVVDFIALPNFPVFNLADSVIVCSVSLLFLASARGIPMTDTNRG